LRPVLPALGGESIAGEVSGIARAPVTDTGVVIMTLVRIYYNAADLTARS